MSRTPIGMVQKIVYRPKPHETKAHAGAVLITQLQKEGGEVKMEPNRPHGTVEIGKKTFRWWLEFTDIDDSFEVKLAIFDDWRKLH